ncbi:right-handed parallel beta-helix repeat-containing protein [Methanobrevibacter sp. DSM 116169]|uniref:right-handed parallel beta-helix repeat-containing protein n=1 Tax=Methanobrevibacter sp. DSM 116169 TaxID=3242727 RepID=UPI0038FC414A
MNMRKAFLSLLVIFLVATSLSCVSAEENIITDVEETNINLDDYNVVIEEEGEELVIEAVVISNTSTRIQNGDSNEVIQGVINNASSGDTIIFDAGDYYNISLTVTGKSLTFIGAGIGQTNLYSKTNGTITMFAISGTGIDGTSFYNMSFGVIGAVNNYTGRMIEIRAGSNITVDSCSFENGAAGIYLQGNRGDTIISNCLFLGGDMDRTTLFANKETGSKLINIMGGSEIYVVNNTFDGPMLDGLSIASGASDIYVSGNKFLNNVYGIYFGGGLSNINLEKNYFENVEIYSVGLVKAATDTKVKDNIFNLTNDAIGIYIEQGNTGHGTPTDIQDIYIDGNEFYAFNGANPYSINAVYVHSKGGALDVKGALEVTNSVLDRGITLFTFFDENWGNDSQINITSEYIISGANTTLSSSSGKRFQVVLKNSENKLIAGEDVSFTINGRTYLRTTDANGVAGLNINLANGEYPITVSYGGENGIKKVSEDYTVTVLKATTKLIGENADYTVKGTQYKTQLVNSEGVGIADAVVSITINTITYYRTTDANGYAYLNINLDSGVYSIYANFDGTNHYEGCTGGNRITTNW